MDATVGLRPRNDPARRSSRRDLRPRTRRGGPPGQPRARRHGGGPGWERRRTSPTATCGSSPWTTGRPGGTRTRSRSQSTAPRSSQPSSWSPTVAPAASPGGCPGPHWRSAPQEIGRQRRDRGPGNLSRVISGWPALALLIADKLLCGMLDRLGSSGQARYRPRRDPSGARRPLLSSADVRGVPLPRIAPPGTAAVPCPGTVPDVADVLPPTSPDAMSSVGAQRARNNRHTAKTTHPPTLDPAVICLSQREPRGPHCSGRPPRHSAPRLPTTSALHPRPWAAKPVPCRELTGLLTCALGFTGRARTGSRPKTAIARTVRPGSARPG
jgi:hypothetical protein